MRVLITGYSGMLGKDVSELLTSDRHEVFGFARRPGLVVAKERQFRGDLTDGAFLHDVLRTAKPDVIIHCAALVNVDECERNKELAHDVHVRATTELATYEPGRVRLIYISTDSVFDGNVGDYREEDATCPINYYALTKQQGEIAALRNNPNSVVLRTNIFGFHVPLGKSLAEWAIESLTANKTIRGFGDAYFNPVYTKQLASLIGKHFLKGESAGIWNVASEGYVSKFEFLLALARVFNLPESLVIRDSMDSAKFIASRPKKTFLNTDKVKSTLGVTMSLQSGLETMMLDYSKSVHQKS